MKAVPHFGVGQVEGVRDYVVAATRQFADRVGIGHKAEQLVQTVVESHDECVTVMQQWLCRGSVPSLHSARSLFNLMGDLLINDDSSLEGEENLRLALDYQSKGHNVIVVQNHRSGADTLVFETMVRRLHGKDVCTDWSYMAGHAVNLFLIPLMFTAGLHRFQIFSAKYLSMGLAGTDANKMAVQNQRALLSLARHVRPGGKLLTFYPEGGRGDDGMKKGELKTMCIPLLVSDANARDLVILPTYVHDAKNILPPMRGTNEYNEIFVHARRGTATLNVGVPVFWKEVMPYANEVEERGRQGQSTEDALRSLLCDTLLGLVAKLGPVSDRGYYATRHVSTRLAELTSGGY